MLSEKKFSKYLLYAIGEVILVVIGILIALQINNQNQLKQNHKLEVKYLKGIKADLNNDIAELERLFQSDTVKFDTYTYLIKTLNGLDYSSHKQEIVSSLYTVAGFSWFEGHNVVFDDMKYSGKLNLIKSDTIRHAIQNYYRFFEEVVKQENMNNSRITIYKDRYSQNMYLSPLIESTFSDRWNGNTQPIDLSFFDTPEFRIKKGILIENFSQIKSLQSFNHQVRLQFYNRAISLRNRIDQSLTIMD